MERRSEVVRGIWALCLIAAGLNHARILLTHGLFWDYGGVSAASAFYLSSLTILDPLVALLLFWRPKAGIVCTVVLIVTNVAHNLTVFAHFVPSGEFLSRAATNPPLLAQIGFMLFVIATAHLAWPVTREGEQASATG